MKEYFFTAATFVLAISAASAGAIRTLTDTTGRKIEAEIMDVLQAAAQGLRTPAGRGAAVILPCRFTGEVAEEGDVKTATPAQAIAA